MKSNEFLHILAAILVLTVVAGFSFALKEEWTSLPIIFAFSAIIIAFSVLVKKFTAYLLDADVEHEIWQMSNYGFKPSFHFKKPVPTGIILPLIVTLFSLGTIKFMPLLTYETRALKHRASKRFGFYSFKEMTDFHNGLIGAAGIFFVLLLSLITYLLPASNLEYLAKMSVYYAFWNLLPVSKLDGTQILFGSRILWAVLAAISAIFVIFALITF